MGMFFIIPGVFLTIIGIWIRSKYSVKVDARCTSSYKNTDSDGRSSYENHYSYTYEGESYTAWIRGEASMNDGKKCRLRINPKKPGKVDKIGMPITMVGIGLLAQGIIMSILMG